MLYLFDANVLIRAHEDYYPLDRIPQFWEWLFAEAAEGNVKMPLEIYKEITISGGPLTDWISRADVKSVLVLDEEVDPQILRRVFDEAYAPDLTEYEMDEAGRDPLLIAYGLMGSNRVIVTKEISKPSKIRGRRKVPDACYIMKIHWMTDFQFFRERKFSIQ